jgi:hypothetical protein
MTARPDDAWSIQMMAGGELDIATSSDVAILSSYRKGRTELALPT